MTSHLLCSVDFSVYPLFGRESGGDQLTWASTDWGCLQAYAGALSFMCRFGNYSLAPDPAQPSALTPTLLPATLIADTPAVYDANSGFVSCRVPPLPAGGVGGTGGTITSVWLITATPQQTQDSVRAQSGSAATPASSTIELLFGATQAVANSHHDFEYVNDSDARLSVLPPPLLTANSTVTNSSVYTEAAFRVLLCGQLAALNPGFCVQVRALIYFFECDAVLLCINVQDICVRPHLLCVSTQWSVSRGGCVQDCNGTYFGSASVDDCGVCSGGFTNRVPGSDKNLCGVCFGRVFTNISDCGMCCGGRVHTFKGYQI